MEERMPPTIEDNATVQIEYSLTVDDVVVDSTGDTDSLTYIHGQGQIPPGLERELSGMKAGDEKNITVRPEDGYGEVDPRALVEVPKEHLPPDMNPETGMIMQGRGPDGRAFTATVRQVGDENVTLDLNHPLAGKTLQFQVKVVQVTPPVG
jgi:FKBP-type peptidyl-prolyl cis-trans isomerase SlyD